MAKTYSLTEVSDYLEQQQEIVYILDKYTQPILSTFDNQNHDNIPNYFADFVMHHIFTNIRNIYQDSIFISQGLLTAEPYYNSTSLSYTLREADEFLIDLAYIVNDKASKQGDEYLRYFIFTLHQEIEVLEQMGFHTNVQTTKEIYDNLLSVYPHLKPTNSGKWSNTTRKDKINQGLGLYITTPNLTDHIYNIRQLLSSEAHGNTHTFYSFTSKPEDNIRKLKSHLSYSVSSFQAVIYTTIKYYFDFYLNKPTIYSDLAKFIRDIDVKMND